jgi:fructose-1,6-bisphosphatase/inositol monophosphatase family enzyme
MIALARDGIVLSAYIGDINTEEIYGYRPGSDKVHRITRMTTYEQLGLSEKKPISTYYALLRNPADRYSTLTRGTLSKFKNYEVTGSSIGTWLAQLWKEEVGAVFMEPSAETPWDSTPIIGISKKLGYVFLKPNTDMTGWVEYEPIIPLQVYHRTHETLIVHRSHLHEFLR